MPVSDNIVDMAGWTPKQRSDALQAASDRIRGAPEKLRLKGVSQQEGGEWETRVYSALCIKRTNAMTDATPDGGEDIAGGDVVRDVLGERA